VTLGELQRSIQIVSGSVIAILY